jgi:hypothetical protein
MKLSERIKRLREAYNFLPPDIEKEFESIYVKLLEIEKTPCITLGNVDNTALSQILENAQTDRDVSDLYLDLLDNGCTEYHSYDEYNINFKASRLKSGSLVSQIRGSINGMINEIKRLEKENEELKNVGI